MNLFAFRKQVDKVLHPIVSTIAKLPLHANHWTFIGAVLGLLGGVVFYYGYFWAGVGILLGRGLIDHVDGFKARNYNQRSTFGAVGDDIADRWVLGVMYGGGCLAIAGVYPHVLMVMVLGITGSLVNVIAKLSIYAESTQDIFRKQGKLGHPVDVVGMFGSAEFIIYFGAGALGTAITQEPLPMLIGCWAVAVLSHFSLLQRIVFAYKRYRHVDPTKIHADLELPSATPSRLGDKPEEVGA